MDIKASITEAEQTFAELIQLVSVLNDEQINTVPFEGSWTAGQLAQHIILSAGGFVQLLNGPVTDTYRDPELNSPNLKAGFLNLNIKMQSPGFIIPEDKAYHKRKLINTLQDIKSGFVKAISTLDITQTCVAFEIPMLGYITRSEAITFTIVHTQRHLHQLKNISNRVTNLNRV